MGGLKNSEASERDLDLMLHLEIIFESAILTPTPYILDVLPGC
jgi:hypothetical protein